MRESRVEESHVKLKRVYIWKPVGLNLISVDHGG